MRRLDLSPSRSEKERRPQLARGCHARRRPPPLRATGFRGPVSRRADRDVRTPATTKASAQACACVIASNLLLPSSTARAGCSPGGCPRPPAPRRSCAACPVMHCPTRGPLQSSDRDRLSVLGGPRVSRLRVLALACAPPNLHRSPCACSGQPDQAARLFEVASTKLAPPLPTRPAAARRQRALQQTDGDGLDQLDEATLARLAETIGSSKTLSKTQLDDMATKIKHSGLKHKINPDHPEKNLKKVIDQLSQGERDLLKSRLHDL
jgi:hypothetical protein